MPIPQNKGVYAVDDTSGEDDGHKSSVETDPENEISPSLAKEISELKESHSQVVSALKSFGQRGRNRGRGRGGRGRGGTPLNQLHCYHCGIRGHLRNSCFKLQAEKAAQQGKQKQNAAIEQDFNAWNPYQA